MVERGGGLIVEVTDGDTLGYRGNLFYDLAKNAVIRLAYAMAADLDAHAVTAVAITPGFLRSEHVLGHFGVREANWRDAIEQDAYFAESETPCYVGRAVAALAADPDVKRRSGRLLSSWGLAREYGFTDIDGRQPDWGSFFRRKVKEVLDRDAPPDDLDRFVVARACIRPNSTRPPPGKPRLPASAPGWPGTRSSRQSIGDSSTPSVCATVPSRRSSVASGTASGLRARGTSRRRARARGRSQDQVQDPCARRGKRLDFDRQRIEVLANLGPFALRDASAASRNQQRVRCLDGPQRGSEGADFEQLVPQPVGRLSRLVGKNPRHGYRTIEHERHQKRRPSSIIWRIDKPARLCVCWNFRRPSIATRILSASCCR